MVIHTTLFFHSAPSMKSKGRTRDETNILASRDKHSVVRSFQASFQEDLKLSKQRSSRHKAHTNEGDGVQIKPKAPVVPFDADKLAKDAGGRYLYSFPDMSLNTRMTELCSGFSRIRVKKSNNLFLAFFGRPIRTSFAGS